MKSSPSSELKKLATTPGPKQYLAFDELAHRVRDDPASWEGPWNWDALNPPLTLKAIHIEWAFLKWSQHLNDEENYELQQEQNARRDELERHLGQEPDSPEHEYFNAIGQELRQQG